MPNLLGADPPNNKEAAEMLVDKIEPLFHLCFAHLDGGASATFRTFCQKVVFTDGALWGAAETTHPPRGAGADRFAPADDRQKPETLPGEFSHLLWER